MTDTVENTGNVATDTAVNDVAQSSDTSAIQDTNTPQDSDDGKVTEADKDNTQDDGAKEEGSDQNQNTGFDVEKLTLPEGITVTGEQKEAFIKDAEALGITTQEGAQKFINWVLEKSKAFDAQLATQQENEIGNLEKQWDEEGKKDPVLGKDYDKNVSDAMQTAGEIFSPRTIEFLKDTRFEKNPDFLKDMLRLHKERADAELISGRSANDKPRIRRDSQGNPMLQFNS